MHPSIFVKASIFALVGLGISLMFDGVASAQSGEAQTQTVPAASADCQQRGWICIGSAYQPAINSFCLMCAPASNKRPDPGAVKALGFTINFNASDVLRTWNASPANKICVGTRCIYYYKTCGPSRCDYEYGNYTPAYGPGMVPLGRDVLYPGNMSITYTTQDALQSAEHNIFLALGPDGDKVFVPLSEVKVGSDGWTIICAKGSTDSRC